LIVIEIRGDNNNQNKIRNYIFFVKKQQQQQQKLHKIKIDIYRLQMDFTSKFSLIFISYKKIKNSLQKKKNF